MSRGPRSAVVAVTMGCQSRCTMCDIWQYGRGREMKPEDYRRLPATLREVNLSGGEPFLRTDLPQIARVIRERCPKARIVISTNGLMPARITRMMDEMRGVAVRVSIDGMGEVNDRVRGIAGDFDKTLETLRRLREAGHTDLGISSTVSRLAVGQLAALKQVAADMGVEFVTSVAHSSDMYFGDQEDAFPWNDRQTVVRDLTALRDRQLRSWNVKEWFRAYFTDGLIDYVYRRPRRLFCHAGTEMFYLSPEGDVYPCNALDKKMGSILADDFETIRDRETATLDFVKRCPVNCWMSCTVAPAMRRNPVRPGLWVLFARFLGLGKRRVIPDAQLAPRPPRRVRVAVTPRTAPEPVSASASAPGDR